MLEPTLVQEGSVPVTDEVTGTQPTDTSTNGENSTPEKQAMSYDELQKRHNGLMSSHQKNLNRLRSLESEKSEWEGKFSDYQSRLEGLMQRLDGIEKSRTKPQAEPDISQMDIKAYTEYVQEKAAEKAMQKWEERQNQTMEQQRQQAMQAQLQEQEQKFQSRWDELLQTDPSVNIKELEDFMMTSRVFDPVYAYNIKYSDLLTKQATTQAAKDTVEKIATNQSNFTEGAGKAGIIPKEKKATTREEKKQLIIDGWNAMQQGKAHY